MTEIQSAVVPTQQIRDFPAVNVSYASASSVTDANSLIMFFWMLSLVAHFIVRTLYVPLSC
jgi:hypothetical protein